MRIEELQLEELSAIRHHVLMSRQDSGRSVLILRFEGEYRDGSAGSPDARYMIGVAKQAISVWGGDAIVFDLRELTYRWGDGMLALFDVDVEPDDSPLPRTAVVSDSCRPALQSLLAGGEGFLFSELAAAVEAADRLSGQQQELEEQHELTRCISSSKTAWPRASPSLQLPTPRWRPICGTSTTGPCAFG